MATDWNDYQEEAAALFRAMGLDAATNVPVRGARTTHDVDVVVKSRHAGFEVQWLVECKHWKVPVSKLHVLGLRTIVAETGSDRGILLCEAGFQSGAIEAATLTNVQVTSLEHVRVTASRDISAMRLRELYERMLLCRERYWNIPKRLRIDEGLRQDVGEWGYSGMRALETSENLLNNAFRGTYPFSYTSVHDQIALGKNCQYQSPESVVEAVELLLTELESKLSTVEQITRA